MEERATVEAAQRVEDEEEEQQVWSWGAGTDGQLGTGSLRDEILPQPLSLPSVSLLSCGGAHVIALSSGTPLVEPLHRRSWSLTSSFLVILFFTTF